MGFPERTWDVLLLGGPSGVGKTSVSYRLAQFFGVGLTEIDDFQVMLETLSTPEPQPDLHFWRTHPDPGALSVPTILEQALKGAAVMEPGLRAVIANHLEADAPVVLEGDYLLPKLATHAEFAGRVRAVFLVEDDLDRLVANFLAREPAAGLQTKRAQVSLAYGRYLREGAEQLGLPCLPARPWDSVLERVLDAVRR